MIGSNYKAHRDNVIDMYDSYFRKRTEFESSMESKEGDGIDLQFLQSRIKTLKNGKFTLAVAGEVKAGKSTFINALLGSDLLPSDVLQATSAIVEIFKSDKSNLKVKYADGREEEIYDDLDTPGGYRQPLAQPRHRGRTASDLEATGPSHPDMDLDARTDVRFRVLGVLR